MALGRDNTQKNTLTEAVELAMYQSLEEGVGTHQDPGTLFECNLGILLAEDTYSITIFASDYEEGILSAEVVLTYENFGYERTASVVRSVVYEYDTD